MQIIYCDMTGYPLNYSIKSFDEETKETVLLEEVPLDSVGEIIANLCNEKGIYNVHLFGNEELLNDTIEDINIISQTKYSKQNIEIEVN